MKFNDLDNKMRQYETALDYCVPMGNYLVARIDGRGFTRLTKEKHDFEKPFDANFNRYMIETVKHLMLSGIRVVYGYTQSDEISLLLHLDDNSFGRKIRKLNSVLAGEASAKFSLMLQDISAFDCRLSILPNTKLVVDYFRWRHEDAHRNALNACAYWTLRKDGYSKREATKKIEGASINFKNELLFEYGINYNELPSWQKRGVGLYWEEFKQEGWNPQKEEKMFSTKNELIVNKELPLGDSYSVFINSLINKE